MIIWIGRLTAEAPAYSIGDLEVVHGAPDGTRIKELQGRLGRVHQRLRPGRDLRDGRQASEEDVTRHGQARPQGSYLARESKGRRKGGDGPLAG